MPYSQTVASAIAEGSKLYGTKQYEEAASKYADACAAFNEENGADDADLLLLYGKALFQSGVTKSGVLGGFDAGKEDGEEKDANDDQEEQPSDKFHFEDGVAQEVDDEEGEHEEQQQEEDESEDAPNKEEEEEQASEEQEQEGQDQSDFEVSWEILDLTRSLFEKKLQTLSNEGLEKPYLKTDSEEPSNEYVSTLKKLAETFDLLGEVSLEAENFPQAALDLESCLKSRQDLFNYDSKLLSESHYKLSLALELCGDDQESRNKATEQMRLAIESVKARNSKEQDAEIRKDTEELLQDLEDRYKELQKPPEADLQAEQVDIIKGILGEAVGSAKGEGSSASQPVNELTNSIKRKAPVNDLSGMVKKRKPDADSKKKQ